MPRISLNYNSEDHTDLKARLERLRTLKDKPYYDRSESETARMVLQRGLDEIEKEYDLPSLETSDNKSGRKFDSLG